MSTIYLTFRYLADIDYPPGDDQLVPYRDHVYRWLRRLEREYDGPLFIRGTHRVHASFHANAIYASVVLGLADDDTDELCTNLLRYQWPGGGWNCNKKPATKGPTIVHTAFGLRGLATYRSRRPSDELTQAIDAAAEVLLERQVYLKRSNGQPLRPVYTKLSYPYPRLYDFMAGLHILTRAGYVTDPRCAKALDLLESKLVPGEGWAMERKLFNHSAGTDGFTHAPWETVTLRSGEPPADGRRAGDPPNRRSLVVGRGGHNCRSGTRCASLNGQYEAADGAQRPRRPVGRRAASGDRLTRGHPGASWTRRAPLDHASGR